jgi:hypothetical protein
LHEVQKELVLFAGDGVEIDAEEAGGGVVQIDFEEELVVLKGSPVAALLAEDVHELEQGHEEAGGSGVVDDVLLDEGLLDELAQLVPASHLVDVDHSLDEAVRVPVVALEPQELPHCVEAVHVLGVELRELE